MAFGLAEISGIEWFSFKSKTIKRCSIKKLEFLCCAGTTASDPKNHSFQKGVGLTIIFGKDQEEQFDDISWVFNQNYGLDDTVMNDFLPFTIYLLGKNGIKIPTLCASGNGYNLLHGNNEETACLFTYTSPCIFDTSHRDENCPSNLI